jgi:hypothetical protein
MHFKTARDGPHLKGLLVFVKAHYKVNYLFDIIGPNKADLLCAKGAEHEKALTFGNHNITSEVSIAQTPCRIGAKKEGTGLRLRPFLKGGL